MIHKFEAVINKLEDKNGAYIEIPFDVEKEFGAKKVETREKRIFESVLKLKEKIKLWLFHGFIFLEFYDIMIWQSK